MVALCHGLAALVPLYSCQLLKAAVKFHNLPTHRRGLNHHFAGQMSNQVIDNNRLNIAVRGHQLEGFYTKEHFFQARFHALTPVPGQRFEPIKSLVAAFFGQAHQPVAFQSREKGPPRTVNALQISAARVP